MDRRTLVYIVGLSLVFILLNQLFVKGPGFGDQTKITSPQTEIVMAKQPSQPISIPPSQYKEHKIVTLFEDVGLKNPITLALELEDNYITFAWDSNVPKELFVEKTIDNVPSVRRLELRIKPENKDDPVFYSLYPLSKMEIPWIPVDGKLDAYLLYFYQLEAYKIPARANGTDQLFVKNLPPQTAFVLLDAKQQLGPYAYYSSKENKLLYFDHLPKFEDYALLSYPKEPEIEKEFQEQNLYVLENDFQQLVFSNLNGALKEINLPFASDTNSNSVVLPIGFDRIMKNDYYQNDTFPQYQAYIPSEDGGKPLLIDPKIGGYTPLIRRNIIGSGGNTTTRIDPHYYGLTIYEVGHTPDAKLYKLKRFEKNLIEFELVENTRRITKTFRLPEKSEESPYVLDVEIKVEGDARDLVLTLGVPEVELISGNFNPTLKYRATQNGTGKVKEVKVPKELVRFSHVTPDWVVNGNGFFGVLVDTLTDDRPGFSTHPVAGDLVPTRLSLIDAQYDRFPVSKYPGYAMHVPLPSKQGVSKFRVFAGPFDKKILKQLDQTYADPYTGYRPDYEAAQSYHGWFAFISQPFAKFLFILLNFFHSLTHSWGFSIILLTLALRLMLYPLNNWSMKSTIKMQHVSPKVQEIQEKYKKDPKRVQVETMNLYKREGVNPFGGCLPMIIQLPFLFGMFDLLKSSFALRGASFIPGWIDNLTAPDVLFSWKYPIIFFGNSFHLLPILLGVIMYFQQKMMSTGKVQSGVSDQQKQQKSVGNIMTIVFTVLFYHFPSGLNIYWISSMLLGILQQWWIGKRMLASKSSK